LKIRPFVASIHRMPLKSNSVDFVVCSEVIEHAPRVDVALKELKRVLKKGGTIIVTFPNESSREKIYPFARLLGMNTKVVRHVTLFSYSKDEIRKKLKKLFRIKKEYSIPPIFPLTNIFVCQKV
jgi:ubiquinone/menaquinone biosynthesis C-methylase UbiE